MPKVTVRCPSCKLQFNVEDGGRTAVQCPICKTTVSLAPPNRTSSPKSTVAGPEKRRSKVEVDNAEIQLEEPEEVEEVATKPKKQKKKKQRSSSIEPIDEDTLERFRWSSCPAQFP